MRAVTVLALGCGWCMAACSDDRQLLSEPPPPTDIAQDLFIRNCAVVEGSLRCFSELPRNETPDPDVALSEPSATLYQRELLFPGPPLPTVDLGTNRAVVSVDGLERTFFCAVLDDGAVKCWGVNSSDVLGPSGIDLLGDHPSERGDGLPAVDLGESVRALQIAVVGESVCARLDGGGVKCWGGPAWYTHDGAVSNDVFGDEPGEMGDALPLVDLGSGVRAVGLTGGEKHACIWTDEGRIKCWGVNLRGQLGIPLTDTVIGDEPEEMGDALPFVDLGTDVRVIQVSAGREHTCALTDTAQVKCWGANKTINVVFNPGGPGHGTVEQLAFGRLGLGDQMDRLAPLGDALPYVDLGDDFEAIAVLARLESTCAVSRERRLKCWGSDFLGLGLVRGHWSVGDAPGEMGDALPYVDLGTGRSVARIGGFNQILRDDGSVLCTDRAGEDGLAGDALPPCMTGDYLDW